MALTKDQRAHLLQRVTTKHGELQYPAVASPPARITAAKKLIAEYDAEQNTKRKAYAAKLAEAVKAAREGVEFASEPAAALAVVKKFEAMKLTP